MNNQNPNPGQDRNPNPGYEPPKDVSTALGAEIILTTCIAVGMPVSVIIDACEFIVKDLKKRTATQLDDRLARLTPVAEA